MVFNCFLGLLKKYIILLLYHLFLECVSILISKMSEILLLGIIMNSETFIYLCVSVHCSCFSFDPEIVLPLVIGSVVWYSITNLDLKNGEISKLNLH